MEKEFKVEITEVRKTTVTLEATDALDALHMAQWLLDDEKIVLGSICRTDTCIEVLGHPLP